MKNWMEKNLGRRLLSLTLALCMVLSVLPPMAYADGDPTDGSVEGTSVVSGNSEGDPSAAPNAGDPADDPNADDPNAGGPADDPNAGSPAGNPDEGGETKITQVCTCENRCSEVDATNSCPLCAVSIDNCAGAQLCEHNLAADCRLCAVKEMLAALPEAPEGADREALSQQLSQLEQALGLLTEEETGFFDLTRYQALTAYLASLPQVVTAWSWIEKDEEAPVLAEELGALVVSFATIENPLYLWMVQDVLPEKLSATVNGEAVELTLGGWSCPDYPAAGCYQGNYTFTTTLPEGYVLGEDVAALEIPVIFMDGTSQWNGTESSVSYIGSDNTPGTCETYTAVTDADAATWSDGWYVVSGNVTIESLTVNGAVSLILKNGSSLKVNSLTVSGGALTVYGQEQKSGTLTIKGGMELLNAPITVVSGAVCAEITLKDTITSSSNIAIPAGMSVDLNMNGKSIGFNDGCGFELGEDSKLALWNEDWTGAFFLYGIKANVPLKKIVKDGFAFFDHTSGSDVFITTIYSNPDTKEYSGKLNVFFHDHDWDYQQVEGDEEHHKAICKDCLTERFETHDLSDLTAKNFDNDYHNLVCECGKIIKTESHVLVSRYYSGTQHLVYCESNCGYERKLSDHVYDEETGVCACGAVKTSYRDTNGVTQTVGCMDFREIAEECKGNYLNLPEGDPWWFVIQGTEASYGITILGVECNLILADGCDVNLTSRLYISPPLTIWGQENGTGRLTVTDANNTAIYATSSLTINGGTVVASGTKAFSALPAMASGMTAYVVDGETEVPVSRATAADVLNGASKVKVTACTQSHDASAEAAYAYVDGSTHRPVCPYCGVSLGGENQPHSFGDSGSCACGAVRGEDGQGVLITTLSGTYSGVTLTGTYLVTGQTTFTDRAEVAGSAKLILADGCTLTAWDGIRVAGGNTLEIEGQDGHTGRLVTTADSQADAPIGGNAEEVSGAITIDGCSVEAEGATDSGIGVSMNSAPGSVTIRNAEVITTKLPEDASITNSIIRMDGNATVYGNATLRSTLNVFDEKSLTVPEGASLTVPQNVSVNISGSLQGSGTIYLLSNDFNANTNNSTVRIWCLLELEDCTVSGEGVLIAHQGKYFCEAGKEITLTPSEGTQADSWKVSYSVTKEVGDEEWETVVTTNYYPGSFTMPAHPVSVKPHIHTFESGVCTVCGAVRAVYWDEKGKEQTITQCTILTEEMNRPTSGWYLVTGTLNLENGLYIVGDVKLILADGAQLIANSGIWDGYGSDSTLTIYGQENGTGILRATSGSSYGAAIGVNNVVINGGSVYAENSDKGFSSSTVQVNRGNVEVTVGEDGYAFSGSLTASQSATIRINAGANLCDSVSGSFIFFDGTEGTVRGAVERTSVPMGADESLLVPEGSTLTLGSTTFTGPVCLKIAQTPTSSLRTVVAAANTALTEENAEAYYPLEYTDCTVSGLNETNSFTRSDVPGPLVKAGTKVQLGYQEPFGKLFTRFDAGEISIGSDNSFTMPSQKVTVKAVFQDAALAVQYTDNGASAYRNYAGTAVTEAFNFAMEQEQATVCLINDVNESNSVELTKGSITLKSDFPTGSTDTTPHKLDVDINLKGGQLTIENVKIERTLTVDSGKLKVTGGYIGGLTVKSADLSDVVISGGSFDYISTTESTAQYKSIYFIMAEGKTLVDEQNSPKDLGNYILSSVKVADHEHRWTYRDSKPDNHVQTCTVCLTSVTAPHKAGQNDLCACGLTVVSYVNHRGEPMGTKGCLPVGSGNLYDGWYVVKGTVHSSLSSISIRGNVNLILTPDSEYKGQEFYFETGSTLTVWSTNTGWTKETVGLLSGNHILYGGKLVLNGGCVQMESLDHGTYDCEVQANGGYLKTNSGTGDGNSIRGSFSTASDGCALIDVITDIADRSNQASWSGIFYFRDRRYNFEQKYFVVYKNQTLNQSIPEAVGLYVPKGAALNYKSESGLNGSDVYVDGTFTGKYDNVYYRLAYPEGTTITADPVDALKTFKVDKKDGTYYKKDTQITIDDSTDSKWLLNNTPLEGNTFNMPAQASVLEKGTVINYYDENGAPQTTYGKLFPTGNEPITLSDNGGAPAWFLLSESKTLDKRLEIEGSVNLVVDAASGKLIANQGIHVGPNATLKLYLSTAAKQDGFGRVEATIVESTDVIDDAVIGGNTGEASGSIFFNGPDVTVVVQKTSDDSCVNGAGIGGGKGGNAGPIVVNRGSISVNIQAGRSVTGAGIGGGYGASNTSFTINDGSVKVQMTVVAGHHTDGIAAAGIGGGYNDGNGSSGGILNFLGGTVNVTLTSRSTAAGIGGGAHGNAGTITISGSANVTSTIDAETNTTTQGAAIGSGYEGNGGSVSISGGNVAAEIRNGKSYGAAIGNGFYAQPVDITITGGWAEANSISQIGEGSDGNGILITGDITDGVGYFTGGLLQLGTNPATVYGTPVFDRNLTTGEGEKLQSIHIPAGTSLTMAQGKTLTNNGLIYLDVGGTLKTAPAAESTGKVYYQVKLGEGIAMQGNDTTGLNASNYARGNVTFSGSTDGYFVTYTDYNGRSQTAYQSVSDYTVTQPITVSAHTHSFDDQGNCTCTVHVTVKVTMGQGESYYGSLGEALEAIGDQEATITLLDDTAGTITISKGNLTIQGEKRIESILVTGGTVKLTGGEIGSLTVQGGTVKLSGGTFGTISSGSGVVTLLKEGFAFRMEDGSWLDGFNGTDTNTLGGGTVCPVPLKNALLTGPAAITYGDSQALTFSVTVNTQSTDTPALSWNRNGDDLSVTGSSCSLSDWDVSRGAGNAVQSYTVTCTASLDGYRLTARHTITINPKTLTISWSNTQFTYDGQPHNPTASSGVSGISLTLSQAQTNAGTHSAQVTGIQGTKAGNYQLPAAAAQSFTISPAAITGVTLKADSGVYTGEVQAPAAKEVKAGALTLNSGDYDLSVSPETVQNAGTYQVTITGKGNFTGSIQKSYTITKAQPSVVPAGLTITYGTKLSGCDLSGFAASFQGTKLPGSFAFDQPDVMPRVADSGTTAYRLTFTPDDGVNFHTASLEVSLTVNTRELTVDAAVQDKQYDGTNKASFISGRPALVGLVDGDVVELSHGEPYFKTVEAGTGIEIRFTDVFVISGKDSINYYLTQPAGITASIYISFKAECGKEYTVNADGWQNTDFVVTANEGYSLSGNNSTEGPWSDKLTVTQEGTGELSFYVRNNTTRAISKLVKEGYRIDKSMPTGTIRFDGVDETESSPRACCKKQTVAVTIIGSDAFSGVASISCFLADAEKTEAELKAITEWMEKTSFTIPAVDGTSCFLYAKVVDNAGNTAYYRANRILFDTSAPSISGVESGKVYYTTQTVTISDPNLESVTLNGKLVDSPVTLKGNVDTAYELLATDKAGNETIMTVTMKSISSITEPLKELTEDNVTEDDRKQLEDAADKLKDLLDTVTDEDEKQKLQDELDKLEELLEILDKVKEVEELLDALPDSVTPDVDKDTEQDIQDARKEFEKLSEHQQSLVDESLKEKLERLEAELVDYQFETGADTVWNRGSGSNLQFVANGRLDKLEKVLLDGKELSNHDFTKSSPKTTIELQEAFLGTLEQGKHTLELVYSDGKAETGFTVMQGTSHLDLTDLPAFDGLTEVEVDGISYPIQELDGKRHVMLPETGDLLTIYTYRNGSAENTHDNYPTGMRVFRINRSVNGATVTELPELADLLIYSGCSIRINGNRGIRMITSMTQSNKDALTGDGLAGFTMLESGTVVQWADSFTGSLNLDSGKHNYAYKRGTADPVFATSGGLTQYTNVLVGFNLDQCSKDIVMRPYVILEDADGKQYTLYGGRVTRSISYIAWQNRDTYQPGTEAYDYVHELMGNTTAG